MNPILLIAAALLIPSLSFADLAPLEFREEDGSPSTFPYQTRVPNGTLTDNADGTISLVYAGAPSGGLFTSGSIPFGDGTASLVQNNANLFWDNALLRLGLGTNAPSSRLEVAGGDAYITGTGPDLRWIPTGGDTFHMGAEHAAGSGSLLFLSNVTDDVKYMTIAGNHTMHFGTSGGSDSAVPSMVFRTQTTASSAINLYSPSINLYGQRQTTANTAGTRSTIQSGGSTSGSTNQPGGDIRFVTGTGTGNAASPAFSFNASISGSSGTADQEVGEVFSITGPNATGVRSSNDTNQFNFFARKSRGTYAAPSAISVGDNLFAFASQAFVGPTNRYVNGPTIIFAHDANRTVTDNNLGADGVFYFYDYTSSAGPTLALSVDSFVGMLSYVNVIAVGSISTGTVAAATSQLDVRQATLGSPTALFETTAASGDNPNDLICQNKITTTDATLTTLDTFAITANRTYQLESRVQARRTGGVAGTADDGAAYVVRAAYTTKAGTVTLLGAVQADYTAEDQAAWNATYVISGTDVLLQVTGAANNDISWTSTTRVSYIGS